MKFLEILTKTVVVLINVLIVVSFVAIVFGASYVLGWIIGSVSGINITLCRIILFILMTISMLVTMNSNGNYGSSNFGKFFLLGCLMHHDAHKNR